MSRDTKQFLKGIFSGYAFMIVSLIVSLWLVPFTLKYLTKPEYAIFAIASDLLSWLSLASLGVGSVLNSKGAQLMGKGDKAELNIITSTTFFTQIVSAVIIIIAGVVVTIYPSLLFSKDASAEHLQVVVAIIVIGYTMSFIFQPINFLLVANKQVHVDNYLKFGTLVIRTGLTVFFLTRGMKLLSLALSNLIATIIISFITWYRFKTTLGDIKINLKLWRFDRFKFLVKNGIWFTIGGLAGIFIFKIDSFMIGQYISLTTVTSYVITMKLYTIADSFHGQFFNTTRPYVAQVYGKGDMPLLSKMHNLSFNLSFTAAFIMGVGVMIINKWFIGIWVGKDLFLGETINMLLCINFIVQASVLPNRIILASTFYKIELHNITRISEGVLKLVVALLLIKIWGVNALTFSSIIACFIFSSIALNYLSSKLIKENFWDKIFLIALVLLIPVIHFITKLAPVQDILLIGLSILVLTIFWFREEKNIKIIYNRLAKMGRLNFRTTQIFDENE
jgi:O-antigen/teichoic acid export membrane protein